MANVKNDWLGYLDRSYQQTKVSLLGRVTNSNPELTDHSDSNPFIILISMFSAIGELMNYYIDNIAEESFIATATRKSSVIKHTRLLDYRIKARHPEQVDLIITWNIPSPAGFSLTAGLSITNSDGTIFYSIEDVPVLIGALSSIVPIQQFTTVNQPTFGTTDGTKNQKISLGTSYLHQSLTLSVAGIPYSEVSTFAFSKGTNRHFIVEIQEDGIAYAILGNGINGILENIGLTIAINYRNTLGEDGRTGSGNFDKDSLTLLNSLPLSLTVANANSLAASSSGTDYEELEDIRNNAVRSIRTLDRIVTRQDHRDVLGALPGVGRVDIHFCCGKQIDIYIVPAGGGLPSTLLINEVQAEAEDKKMVTTFPTVRPAGETSLVIAATVTAKKRKSVSETKTQVEEALIEFGLLDNQEINGAIRLSDIQALIDNLTNVDFVDLTEVYTKPYARPTNHNNPLVWNNLTKVASIVPVNWRLEYVSSKMRIFKEAIFQGEIPIGSTYVDPGNIFEFNVQANSYVNGQLWEFTTYPYLKNIELEDFTIFKINLADLNITVNAAPINPVVKC